MLILVHENAKKVVRIIRNDSEVLVQSASVIKEFWRLGRDYPEDVLIWIERQVFDHLNIEELENIFHHNLIMASYAVNTTFLPESIGYIDQSPFVNVNRKVLYPTWLMSSDIGGIKGETLLKFNSLFGGLNNFEFLLNSIAKIGQQNGLFCYSAPDLVRQTPDKKLKSTATSSHLYSFVYNYYKTIWLFVLLWCFWKYESKFPIKSCFLALLKEKYFLRKVDLSGIKIHSNKIPETSNSIDVIIPTMGRSKYLMQVIEDLSQQSLLPKKVIVVEQNPDLNAISELQELTTKSWPFKIRHHFIHQTGACNARNIALEEVDSDWVFFCDDDNRIQPQVLAKSLSEIRRYGIQMLNTAYLQPGEKVVFDVVKQWGTFGTGNGIIQRKFIANSRFSSIYEHGYGEDIDFGMQLRQLGCDIIYHPEIEIIHLKAPMGGFREKPILAWEQEVPLPKPSPTLMAFALKYYTQQQIKGFKTSLFLKYYNRQHIKNPINYVGSMRKRWEVSEEWAKRLLFNGSKV